jgi:uncharacterized membrane protein YadS
MYPQRHYFLEGIVMKTATSIAMLLAACSCVAGASAWASEEVLIQSGQERGNPEVKAINACFTAFINRIMPAARVKVRTVIADQRQVFHASTIEQRMNVEMTAKQGSHGAVLASGYCTVDRGARVQYLSTTVVNAEKLASLTVKDLSLASR